MKIKTVRCVHVNAPAVKSDPNARPVWNEYATRSLPISRYGEKVLASCQTTIS